MADIYAVMGGRKNERVGEIIIIIIIIVLI